jgi:hypothetical protein
LIGEFSISLFRVQISFPVADVLMLGR